MVNWISCTPEKFGENVSLCLKYIDKTLSFHFTLFWKHGLWETLGIDIFIRVNKRLQIICRIKRCVGVNCEDRHAGFLRSCLCIRWLHANFGYPCGALQQLGLIGDMCKVISLTTNKIYTGTFVRFYKNISQRDTQTASIKKNILLWPNNSSGTIYLQLWVNFPCAWVAKLDVFSRII